MKRPLSLRLPAIGGLLAFLLAASGCAAPDAPPEPAATRPVLANRADSVAMRIFDASGGPEAWASVAYLRFDFGSGDDSSRTVRARHLWNRQTGEYRVEMPVSDDSVYVALFDVDTREGTVYLNGQPVDSTQNAEMVQRAYGRFINDTYWLLVPLKTFDPGVTRTYVPDSSTAEHDVVTLTFADVGLTPGDQYWLYANRQTGRLERWAYRLRHFEPTTPTAFHAWEDYSDLQAPAGTIHLATRKRGGRGSVFTDNLDLPTAVPPDLFTDPGPRL